MSSQVKSSTGSGATQPRGDHPADPNLLILYDRTGIVEVLGYFGVSVTTGMELKKTGKFTVTAPSLLELL